MRLMGRFKKFLPYTALAMVVAWLAIAGVPPFSGFWAKDEIISSAYEATDYGLWIVALIAAVFTGFYMTRLIFMTFYGNERWSLTSDAAVPVVSGGSDDVLVADAHAVEDASAPDPDDPYADSDPSPTVAYGEPVHYVAEPKPPHESPMIMVLPVGVLALLAAVMGVLDLPFKGADFLTIWLEPVFHGVEMPEPTSFVQGTTLEIVAVLFAITGIGLAYLLYRAGVRRPEEDPIQAKLGPVAPVLGNAYYYDAGISKLVDGPLRAFASFLDRVVDAKIIDGTVNGVGWVVKQAGGSLRHLQDGLVRRYALGIAFGTVAILLYLLLWAGR
jgi:NADH-quinone oxidoreductase subunit L